MFNVGLIGAGVMGRTHLSAYSHLSNAKVVAICDSNYKKAKKLVDTKLNVVTDYNELLQDPEIDVVDICLPTYLHKDIVLAAAKAGKHVFCEKPLALSLDDGYAMIKACRDANVKLGVGHVVRFFPEYYRLRDVLKSGKIGEAKVVRTSRGGSFPLRKEDNWYGDYTKSGGPIVDLVIHDFDFLLWLFGPISRVFAKSVKGQENFDHTFITLRFENGVIAHVEGSWAQPKGTTFATSYEVAGTKGLYEYASEDSKSVVVRTSDGQQGAISIPKSPLAMSPYAVQLGAYFNALANDQAPPVSGEDALNALKVALAAKMSADTGEVVFLGGEQND